MNVRWKESLQKPHISKIAMKKFEIRADVEKQMFEKARILDDRRWEELNAYATSVDATILMTLHNRYHFTARVLREIWEDMIRLRIETRQYFRDGDSYEEQRTGHNIEDTAIFHDLMSLGVDIKAWEAEEIVVDEVSGEVSFRGK